MIVDAADHVISVKIMETAAHLRKPLSRICADHFRRLKAFPGRKIPGKLLSVDTHHHSHTVELVYLRLSQKITGINKMHRINLSLLSGSTRRDKRYKGVLLMARLPPHRTDGLFPIVERLSLNMPFSGPGTTQTDHLKVFIVHIQTGAVYFF